MNRFNTLDQAADEIKSRPSYGPVRDNFNDIAAMWSVILDYQVTAEQVGMMMITLKICREKYGHKSDNFVDMAGFAAITNEIAEEYDGSISPFGGSLATEPINSDPQQGIPRQSRGIAHGFARHPGSEFGEPFNPHLVRTESDSEGGDAS